MTQTSPSPSWLPLAETAIARLRRYASQPTEFVTNCDPDPRPDRLLTDMLLDAGAVSRMPPDLRDDLLETGADPEAIDLATGQHRPAIWIGPQRLLLAIQLAVVLATEDSFRDWLLPGAVTVLSGITDIDLLRKTTQRAFLPATWRASVLQLDSGGEPTLLIVAPDRSVGRMTSGAATRFSEGIGNAMEAEGPVLIALAAETDLPPDMEAMLPAPVCLPALGADILITLLRHTHSATGRIDETAVRAALPSDAILAEISRASLLLALRAETALAVAQRLAQAGGREIVPPTSGPTLEHMTGESDALIIARRMIADLRAWRSGEIAWTDLSRSVLFYGPPGTGKTWMARAMGASAGIALIEGSFATWQGAGHLGDMLREMQLSFAAARRQAPAILFIDEIDAVGNRDDSDRHGSNYRRQVINGFLGEMDRISRQEGVIVVGACNNIGAIDPAVLRPGRFDHHVPVPLPDAAMLAGVLVRHLGSAVPPAEIGDLARRAVGRSAADLDAAIRSARSLARHEARELTLEDVAHSLDLGADTSTVDWRVAVHECGHAIVAAALRNSRVTRITLLPDGGETARQQLHNASMMLDIEIELATQLAGRAAEAVVFSEVSAGGGGGSMSDLAHATRLALAVHTQLGLGWNGPVWSDGSPDLALRDPGLRLLVRRRLEDAERRAKAILADQLDLLLGMARDLLRQRRLAGQELEHWLAQVRAVNAAVQCEADENQENCAHMAKHEAKPAG